MRKIHFNVETIDEIRKYIESGHTIHETCNRFTLKQDTLRRVMYENDIKPYHKNKSRSVGVSDEVKSIIVKLYKYTHMRMQDIVDEVKLPYYVVLDILQQNFTEEYMNNRKSQFYRESKLGEKNPMTNKCGENHPNYRGLVEDGNGYYMISKPDWYTGRKGSKHVFHHSVVMSESIGITEIPKGFVVHHIDGDKHNNSIDNLCLMTNAGHSKLHSILRNLCKVQRLSTTE